MTISLGSTVLLNVTTTDVAANSAHIPTPPVGSLWYDQAAQCYGGTTLPTSSTLPGVHMAAVLDTALSPLGCIQVFVA